MGLPSDNDLYERFWLLTNLCKQVSFNLIAFKLKLQLQVSSIAGENVIFREIKLNYIKVIFQPLLHQALISKCLVFGKS